METWDLYDSERKPLFVHSAGIRFQMYGKLVSQNTGDLLWIQ